MIFLSPTTTAISMLNFPVDEVWKSTFFIFIQKLPIEYMEESPCIWITWFSYTSINYVHLVVYVDD
jgi:hypothetical protein